MTTATLRPGQTRPFYRRMPKPDLSRFILVGTALVVAGVLLVWLLLWIVFLWPDPARVMAAWFAPTSKAVPVVGFQADDGGRFGKSFLAGGGTAADYKGFQETFRGILAGRKDDPIVLYLSTPGIYDSDGSRVLLRSPTDDSPAMTASTVSLGALLDLLGEYPTRKKLLLLDAGQVGTDRNLGVFGNGFLDRAEVLVKEKKVPNLAVLSACAPGQTSWASESDRRSAFGHFVAEGLTGAASGWDESTSGLTVRGLARFVGENVSGWVAAHRQAVQTPALFSDPAINFSLRRVSPPRLAVEVPAGLSASSKAKAKADAEAAADKAKEGEDKKAVAKAEAVEGLLAKLQQGWADRDALAKARPYHHAPLLWRRYQEGLLRVERLIRAGRDPEAERELEALPVLKRKLTDRAGGLPIESPWSLAIARRDQLERPEPERPDRLEKAARTIEIELDRRASGQGPADPGPDPAQYLEGQLLGWASAFADRPGAPAFGDERGRLLRRAIEVRLQAERAAAPDERVIPWVAGPVLAADAIRLGAQDDLFAGTATGGAPPRDRLDESEDLYRKAIVLAEHRARALDLVERVAAELPDLGGWRARRDGRHGEAPDLDFERWLEAAAELAGLALAAPGTPSAGPPRDADPLEALDRLHDQVKAGFDRLDAEFRILCDQLATSAGPGHWRDLDELLNVPTIPAETRAMLLKQIQTHSASLSSEAVTAARPADPGEAGETPRPEAAVDPAYWPQAINLARLEWALLALAGADDRDLLRVADAFETARRSLRSDPAEAFADLSGAIRRVRSTLMDRVHQQANAAAEPSDPALAAADRAARPMAMADAMRLPGDAATEALDRARRHDLLIWHARRLLADFDPERALTLLVEARRARDTQAVREAEAEAQEMTRARLRVATDPAGAIALNTAVEFPMSATLAADPAVPPGRGVVWIGSDPAAPMSIVDAAARRDASEGLGAPVRPGGSSEPIGFALARGFSDKETVIDLVPTAFFRGRTFAVEAPLHVTLNKIRELVAVTLEHGEYTKRWGIVVKDQFKEHPGKAYLHFETDLAYRIVLTSQNPEPLKVWVGYGLEGKEAESKVVDLGPGRRDADSVTSGVRAHEVPVGQPRTLRVVVRKEDAQGVMLATPLTWEFHQIKASSYVEMPLASYDPARGAVVIRVTHKPDDGVAGPSGISAEVMGIPTETVLIERGRMHPFIIPLNFIPPPQIPWSVYVEHERPAFTGTIMRGVPGQAVPPVQPQPQPQPLPSAPPSPPLGAFDPAASGVP